MNSITQQQCAGNGMSWFTCRSSLNDGQIEFDRCSGIQNNDGSIEMSARGSIIGYLFDSNFYGCSGVYITGKKFGNLFDEENCYITVLNLTTEVVDLKKDVGVIRQKLEIGYSTNQSSKTTADDMVFDEDKDKRNKNKNNNNSNNNNSVIVAQQEAAEQLE